MRLALVIPGFQSDEHDWCIPAFTNLAHALAEHVDLHVFALRYPQRRDDYTIGRVTIHSIGAGAIFGARLFGVSLVKLWSDFARTFAAEQAHAPFDAVIGVWATESGWLATRSAQDFNIPSLLHLAGGEVVTLPYIRYGNRGQGMAGCMVQTSITNATLLTVPSEPVMRALRRLPGLTAADLSERVHRWSLGVDTRMFAPQEPPPSDPRPFTFVTVGSLIPVKGHKLLIDAVRTLRHQTGNKTNVRLRIVGDGPLRSTLCAQVRDYNLEGYVTFDGEVPHDHLPALYAECDAFLLGSHYEAQCMALLEAMSCGLPWVAPLVGCVPDIAQASSNESSTGFIFDRRKPVHVASAMLATIELSPEERRLAGIRAREIVLQDYELQHQTDRLLQLVTGLLPRAYPPG
jgi:glycosyltransferase involved in cell wall biosynthesis